MDENWECVAFSVCRCACDTCANANGQEHTQHVSLRVPVEHPKKIHTNWYDLLCQRENSQRLCATATCYLDKLLRKRWNSTTSTRRFVCKRFQHVRKKSTESFKSPLNFVSRCKLLGLIRSNSTETNPWTWMTFSEKNIVLNQCAGPGTILAQSARQQPSKFETEHDWFLSYIDSCARFGQRG